MMKRWHLASILAGILAVAFISASALAREPSHARTPATQPTLGQVHVGMLTYGKHKQSVCFADGFLATVARHTTIKMDRKFHHVALGSDELFDWPFVVMTGHGNLTLSKSERAYLKRYLRRGGFVLASAGCASPKWAHDFAALMRSMFGKKALTPIKLSDPVFHTIFDIKQVQTLRATRRRIRMLQALRLDGRLAVLFSPIGLNDTADAGGGCCCCGGNEIRNARAINADVLVYVLTH